MKLVFSSLILCLSLSAFAQSYGRDRLNCEGATLVAYGRQERREVHRFSFTSECQTALIETARYRQRFCDGSQLFSTRQGLLRDLTFSSECQRALETGNNRYRIFCDDNELVGTRGETIHRFSFRSDCLEGHIQALRYSGHFCADRDLKDVSGYVLASYTFASECREALAQGQW